MGTDDGNGVARVSIHQPGFLHLILDVLCGSMLIAFGFDFTYLEFMTCCLEVRSALLSAPSAVTLARLPLSW